MAESLAPIGAEACGGNSEADGGRESEGAAIWRKTDRSGGARLWMALNMYSRGLNSIQNLT